MQLAECPPNLILGINAAESKDNFVQWLDDIIRLCVQPGVDVKDRDALQGESLPLTKLCSILNREGGLGTRLEFLDFTR